MSGEEANIEKTRTEKEPEQPKKGDLYKIVIRETTQGPGPGETGATIVGVCKTGCDPVFFPVTGCWADAVSRLPEIMVQAFMKWKESLQNPKYDRPAPPPPPPGAQPAPRPATPTRSRGGEKVEEYKLL